MSAQIAEYYATTPPVEALRLILSVAAESPTRVVRLVDISRAYFNAPIRRTVYVELPRELGLGRDVVGLLQSSMYGCRDAAASWEETYQRAQVRCGLAQGVATPCVFWSRSRDLCSVVHGDDLFTTCAESEVDRWEVSLLRQFDGKVKGTLRAAGDEVRVLNRVARRTARGYEWEGDQRHAELLCRDAGLVTGSRGLTSTGRSVPEPAEGDSEPLAPAEATAYRASTARANYASADRPDIAFSVKERCRAMCAPTAGDARALKHLCRYLLDRPRLVWRFDWQPIGGPCGCFATATGRLAGRARGAQPQLAL